MLKRIVVLLYAFARLAESLCDRPRPVRCVVLWILRYAETIARDFVMDTALDQGASAAPDLFIIPALHAGESSADAMHLAGSFRALAVLLGRLADGNQVSRRISITKLCLNLTACAAEIGLSAGTKFGRQPLCLAVERCDSS